MVHLINDGSGQAQSEGPYKKYHFYFKHLFKYLKLKIFVDIKPTFVECHFFSST